MIFLFFNYITFIIPIYLISMFIFKYDTYEINLNMNSNLTINIIYKISNYWSLIENNFLFLLTCMIFFFIYNKKKYLFFNSINLFYFILFTLFTYYNFYINSNIFYTNTSIFNPLLTHFLVFIHPPMILTILLLIKNKNYENKKIINYFYYFTFTLLLGSYWATSVFGWGGWWTWDPIENITLIYWFLLLFYIHKINKIKNYIYLFLLFIDFYLFFFLKFNNFQSIHVFKLIYINIQFHFIYIYIIFNILIFLLYFKKTNKLNTSLFYIINTYIIYIVLAIISYMYIYMYVHKTFLFYILIMSTIFLYLLLLTRVKKEIYFLCYLLLITILYKQIYMYFIYLFYSIMNIKIKKYYFFYITHLFFLIIIYNIYYFNNEINEISYSNIFMYEQMKDRTLYILNEVETNLNYIEYQYKIKINNDIIYTNNYYNIYNIFEKIEFNIYNFIYNNMYINIKENVIQVYKIKYIITIFIIVTYLLYKRYK